MNKKRTNILFIGMALIAIIILIGTGAYAYYQTNISGTTSGTIARWSFKANNQTETFNIDIDGIYPGKSGTYNIELSAEDSDLDIYYELIFTSTENYNGEFYFDSEYKYKYNESNTSNSTIGRYGIIEAGTKIIIPLYYYWNYNSEDNEAIADGSHAATANVIINSQQYMGENITIFKQCDYSNKLISKSSDNRIVTYSDPCNMQT